MIDIKNITVNAQSSIRIQGSRTIYFDPFKITDAANDADIIFITHEHYDHFSPEDFRKVSCKKTKLVIPASMKKKITEEMIIQEDRIITLFPYEVKEIDGILVNGIPAYNENKPFHEKKKGWLGYKVTMDDTVVYVAGDTDSVREVSAVKCDIALIPIGGKYTFDFKKAAEAVNLMKPGIVIPTHYGSIVGSPKDGEKFAKLVDGGITTEKLIADGITPLQKSPK